MDEKFRFPSCATKNDFGLDGDSVWQSHGRKRPIADGHGIVTG